MEATPVAPKVAVVCGGPSSEAEVSRSSGRCVAEALRASYPEVALLELDRSIGDSLRSVQPDVVFPILHGPPGEDGTFQGFLETLGLPYVGSGVAASAFAMDKVVSKQIFRAHALPVAADVIVDRLQGIDAAIGRIRDRWPELKPGCVVKPSRQGSAVGVRFACNPDELEIALQEAFRFDRFVLVEERIAGREITVGILERADTGRRTSTEAARVAGERPVNEAQALPVIEIRTPESTWYDYEHRYTPGQSRHLIPAPLPEDLYLRVQEIARHAHRALGCRDLSRADFVVPIEDSRVGEGNGDVGAGAVEPLLLEVNTLPGMTPTSLYPDAARAAGISFEELCKSLVELALGRGEDSR